MGQKSRALDWNRGHGTGTGRPGSLARALHSRFRHVPFERWTFWTKLRRKSANPSAITNMGEKCAREFAELIIARYYFNKRNFLWKSTLGTWIDFLNDYVKLCTARLTKNFLTVWRRQGSMVRVEDQNCLTMIFNGRQFGKSGTLPEKQDMQSTHTDREIW